MRGMSSIKHLRPFMWKKGQSGNPSGRPKHARQQLSFDFLTVLADVLKRAIAAAKQGLPVPAIVLDGEALGSADA